MIRTGADPDAIANRLDDAVARLSSGDATVVLFTAMDVGFSPVFSRIRGKVAIYNENLRVVAAKHDVLVADMWALRDLQTPGMWTDDRLHMAPLGHHTVARMVLEALDVDNDLEPMHPEPLPAVSWRRARTEDLVWAREYLVPWVLRRLRHQSSGDNITAKRPEPVRVEKPKS